MSPIHAVRTRRPPALVSILAAFALSWTLGAALGVALAGRPAPVAAQPASPAITPAPSLPGGTQIMLPALGPLTGDPACRTSIHIQLAGNEDAKVVLLTWGAPGACPADGTPGSPGPPGPLRVECSGLLVPGGGWVFADPPILAGARSGAIFSFNTKDLMEIFVDFDIAICDVVADLMCEELFFGVRNDADEYQLFKRQFDAGGLFRDIPLDRAVGGPIVAWVDRTCPGPGGADGGARAVYAGVSGTAFGGPDPADGQFSYGLPKVVADPTADRSSQVHVQNAGSACANVELRFHPASAAPHPDCGAAAIPCAPLSIAPGESVTVDLRQACGVGDTGPVSGSLWLESTGPLAMVVDTPAGAPDGGRAATSSSNPPDAALAAPLLIDSAGAWRARLHLRNHDWQVAARVLATVWDDRGEPILAEEFALCPGAGGSWDIDLPAGLPSPFVGSLSVFSQPVAMPDGNIVPLLTADIALIRAGDGDHADQAAAYALAQAGGGVPGQGAQAGGTDVGAVLLPALAKAATSGGPSSALVVANTAGAAGTTDFAVLLFDKNGFVDHACRALGPREARRIDLAAWPRLPAGFVGSGLVSATTWNHAVAGEGGAIRNAVGLAAVVIEPGLNAAGSLTGELMAAEGLGLAPGEVAGTWGGGWQGDPVVVPACPAAPRLVSPTPWPTDTPMPTRTRRPTATPTTRPVLDEHVHLPLTFKARVGRR